MHRVLATAALLAAASALAAPPAASTSPATGITTSSAVLNGAGTPNGEVATGWFRYSPTNPVTCDDTFGTRVPATGGTNLGSGSTSVPYSITTTGLVSGTTYFFCAIVQNASGTAFGTVLSFTIPGAPVTLTVNATSVTATSATLNGSANPVAASTTGWFRYSAVDPGTCNDTFGTRAPGTGGSALGSGTASVDYARAISSLTPGTTYYFCAIASNVHGTTFGAVLSFITPAAPPVALTLGATGVTATSATLQGQGIPNADSTTAWFRYSAINPGSCNDTFGIRLPATGGSALGSGTTAVSYSHTATGLQPGTTYFFCAIAQNALGIGLGTIVQLTTSPVAPAVTTLPATPVTAFSATLRGQANPGGASTTGWFRYSTTDPGTCNDTFGTRVPSSSGAGLGSGNSDVAYSFSVAGLTPTTTYYFCAIAQSSAGAGTGAVLSFTTPAAPPTVTTFSPTPVTGAAATLRGRANPNGDAATGWFRYDTTSPGTCNDTFGTRVPATGGTALGGGIAPIDYSEPIAGLTQGTTYFVCAIAANALGTSVGSVISFTTPAPPTVTTDPVSGLTNVAATLNGTANPNRASTTGWFRYSTTDPGTCNDTFGTRAPATGGIPLGSGASPFGYWQGISVSPVTTYYSCAIASNAEGISFGTVRTFTTPGAPAVVTNPATLVTSSSAQLNASVTPNGSSTSAWFRYGTTDPGTCNTTFGSSTTITSAGSGTTPVAVARGISALLPGTTYYFCAIASNGYGTTLGDVLSFTTQPAPPAMTTDVVSVLAPTTATLPGTGNPGGAATTGWFRYDLVSPGTCNDAFGTRAPATGGTALGGGTAAVPFSQAITGLVPGTTYFYCAIGQNVAGTGFGLVRSFTTPTPPTVTTNAATSLTNVAATLNGTGVPNNAATTGWFRYSTTNPGVCDDAFGSRAPVSGGVALGSGAVGVPYSSAITGLSPNTTYFYCAIVSSAYGTAFGALLTFTTHAPPTVTTNAATLVTAFSATLNGDGTPNGATASGWYRYSTVNPGACNDSFGTRTPTFGGTNLGAGTSPVPFPRAITSLVPVTTYYFCAIAGNSYGTSLGELRTFTTPAAAPAVSTMGATNTGLASVTLNGVGNPEGDAATGYFRYGTVSPGTCNDTFGTRVPATGGTALGSGVSNVAYNQPLTGLTTGTTYYFCALASNGLGTGMGAVQTFVPSWLPTVTTTAATGVSSTGAVLNSLVNPNASGTFAYYRYSSSDPGACSTTFGSGTTSTNMGSGTAALTHPVGIGGLSPGTTYYYCAIASNGFGTTLGNVLTFATPPAQPAAVTVSVSALTNVSATLNGSGNPGGGAATGWFRYDTVSPGTCNDTFGTRAPATGGSALGSGSTAVPYAQAISGLTPSTQYYYCAIVQNSVGTAFGAVSTFVTPTAPLATTNPATNITGTSAQLNGSGTPNRAFATGWYRYSTVDPGTCNDTFGTRLPAASGQFLGQGSTPVDYANTATGLTPGTTYYYCAIVSNAYGTAFGAVLSFSTFAPPAVTTNAATALTGFAATLNGSADPRGTTASGWFRYSATDPGTCNDTFGTRAPTFGGIALGNGSAPVDYSVNISGLLPGTTYYVCAIAQNGVSIAFGAVVPFTSPALVPAVSTTGTSGVTDTTATLLGSANPNGANATGYFRYATVSPGTCNDTFGSRAPAVNGAVLGGGNSAVAYSQPLVGLTPGTTFYFCAIAQSSAGTGFGPVQSFVTLAAPSMATLAATPVTSTTATLNGTGNPNRAATTAWFRYSTVNPGTCDDTFGTRLPATGGSGIGSGSMDVGYSQAATGLTPATTYYFCAIGTNSVGLGFGAVLNFTTPAAAPTATTLAPSPLSGTAATLRATGVPAGDPTTGWFRYATTNPGTCTDSFGTRVPAAGGTALGSGLAAVPFSEPVSGLVPGTTYWVCALAQNAIGVAVGTAVAFTAPQPPQVATSVTTGVGSTTATLNGSANPGSAATTGWFRYSTVDPGTCNDAFGTRAPATGGADLGAGSTAQPYAQALTGLAPGTTYYACAIAQSSEGTGFGSVTSFTTTAPPAVTSGAATLVTAGSAQLNGDANPNLSTATGWFRYSTANPGTCNDTFGTRAPSTGGSALGAGGGPVAYSRAITGLSSGATYYYCAIASNGVGTGFGQVRSFTTQAAPTVVAQPASPVGGTTATLNATANPNLSDTTGWFRYATTNPGACNDTFGTRVPASGGVSLGAESTAVPYAQALIGLTPGATYFFCAVAQNAVGTSFSAVTTFTTSTAPAATTTAASAIDAASATLNGTANPGRDATTAWFRYDTVSPGTCNDSFGTRLPASGGTSVGSGSAAVAYSQPATGLQAGATYYFCAIAQNSVGTALGSVLSFTTPSTPAVTTSAATLVGSSTAQLNGSANPNLSATGGWFRYDTVNPGTCNDTFGTRAPATGDTSLGSGSTAVAYSRTVTGLTPGTTYYVCAIAQNAVGLGFGAVMSFTTAAPPAVTTAPASPVSGSGATLNGSANPNLAATTGWFRYATVDPGTCNDTFGTRAPATGGTALGAGSAPVSYSQAITGLAPGTTYYFCAIASNAQGTGLGPVSSFTTPSAPAVSTLPASAVSATSATLHGSGTPNLAATTGWFRYATVDPGACNDTFGVRVPATGGSALGSGSAPVAYSEALAALTAGATYYFCAIAQNAAGTTFGGVQSFTTQAAPAVTTVAASSVGSAAATLNGLANPNRDATTAWFRYSTTNPGTCNDTFGSRAPASGGSNVGAGSTAVAYAQVVASLSAGTTYYYCAIAQSSVGMSFGGVLSFTTPAAPLVATQAATGVTSTGAVLNGQANPNRDAATGWFRYDTVDPGTCSDGFGVRAPATGGAALGAGSSAVPYAQPLSGLQPATTYFFCAIAQNAVGLGLGAVQSFTTPAAPAVATAPATSVGSTAATLNGSANPNLSSTTGWFRYGTVDPGACNDAFGTRAPATGGPSLGSGSTAVAYALPISGLTAGTTYYFCAIAQNGVGTAFGALQSFTTTLAPAVTSLAATAVTGTSATLNGTANPNLAAATGWFRYDVVNPGTCNDAFGVRAPASGGTALGSGGAAVPYSVDLSALATGTTYYFCAIAQSSAGVSFGAVQSFITTGAPLVSTLAASPVGSATATLNGSANPNRDGTSGWFRYSAVNPGACNDAFGTRAPATGGVALGSGTAAVPYGQAVSGLTAGGTYYFCAIAQNSVGITFGTVQSFTTTAAPAALTLAATSVTSTGASLNGSGNPNGDTATGWFRYDVVSPGTCNDAFGVRAPATGGASLGSGTTAVPYGQAISGLSASTTYFYCAIVQSPVGVSFGAVLSFTTTAAPSVATLAASAVASASATLNGSANPNLGSTTGWFRYAAVSPGACNDTFGVRAPASGGSSLGAGNVAAPYSQPITGLTAGTTYYFCAIAQNPAGTSLGALQTFTTTAGPAVTTLAVSDVTGTSATFNASANPNRDATTGWFRYAAADPGTCDDSFGVRAPAAGGAALGNGSSAVPYSEPVTGLAAGTTYYVCAIAQNAAGLAFGAVQSFVTAAAPVAVTQAASGVGSSGGTLHGSVTPQRDATAAWFRYDSANPGSCDDVFGTRTPGVNVGAGSGAVPVSAAIGALSPNTTYYFCAVAQNSVGTRFGSVLSFTTSAAPAVATGAATSVSSTGATLNGTGVPNRDDTTAWFRFDTASPGSCNDTFGARAPASGGASLGAGSAAVAFSEAVTGLAAGTTYYACAIAQNSVGVTFGALVSFTTASPPAVTTAAATSVGSAGATLNGAATPNGAATTGWFRYSTTHPGACDDTFGARAPASGGAALGSGAAAVPFSVDLAGLAAGTTYYACAIAQNAAGISFGGVQSFRTSGPPAVVTAPASALTASGATLHGSANPNQLGTTGWFRYDTVSPGACDDSFGSRAPASGGTAIGAGSASVDFSEALAGLMPGTRYYFCAIASNAEGTRFGGLLSFDTPPAPAVTTSAATAVRATAATLNGAAVPGAQGAVGWFRYDVNDPGSCGDGFGTRVPASGGTALGGGAASVPFSEAIGALQPGTRYFFCAIASSSAGMAFGQVLSFTTTAAPAVSTEAPTQVSATGAILNGSANPGGEATTGWFRYATVSPGTCDDVFGTRAPAGGGADLGAGRSPAAFSQALTGLMPGTTYYFCALAENPVGVRTGAVQSFTTGAPAPIVSTQTPADLTATGVTLVGSANPRGHAAAGWFRYGTVPPAGECDDSYGTRVPGVDGLTLGAGTADVPFSAAVTGLSPTTTYHYCAAASSQGGAAFGAVRTFTTLAGPPAVRTTAADAVGRDAATLNGAAIPNGAETIGWFRYSETQPAACDDTFGTRTAETALGAGQGEVAFSAQVAGLQRGAYYYCAIASSSAGMQFGQIEAFTVLGTSGGCGCSGAGGLLVPGALMLVLLLRRRDGGRGRRRAP